VRRKPSGTFVSVISVAVGLGLMVSALPVWGGSSATLSASHQLPDNTALFSSHNLVFSTGDRYLERCRSAADDHGVKGDHPTDIDKTVGMRSKDGPYFSGPRDAAQRLSPRGPTFRLRAQWTRIALVVRLRADREALRDNGCEEPATRPWR
jgi:hypothetical protein